MHRYKILLAYEGTNYSGWQIQPQDMTIQQLLESNLKMLLKLPILSVIGSSRTDAGVHALGQVAHFSLESPIVESKILYSLNCVLPEDIRVLSLEKVDPSFHARYSAKRKIYYYHLSFSRFSNPFERNYRYLVPYDIDLDLLQKGCQLFQGTHDFTSFSNESEKGCCKKNPIRTIFRLELVKETEGFRLEFEGDGFLYKMVRNIAGTLIDLGRGKLSLSDLQDIFLAKDRRKAGQTAPAHGLFLVSILYRDSLTNNS